MPWFPSTFTCETCGERADSEPCPKCSVPADGPIDAECFKSVIAEIYDGFVEDLIGSDCREESMIVLASFIGPVFADEAEIARTLGYPRDFVVQIGRRIRRSGHWDGAHIPKDFYDIVANNENGFESNICLTLMVMIACGRIYAQRSGLSSDFHYCSQPFAARKQAVRDETLAA